MIYISTNNKLLSQLIEKSSVNQQCLMLQDKSDIFDVDDIKSNDIFCLSLELFESVSEILSFMEDISSKLNIIVFREVPNLAEGTLLVKKGIKSYLPVKIDSNTLSEVIKIVQQGNSWVYPDLMDYIIKQINIPSTTINDNVLEKLSLKEKEVALLVASGNSNQNIAQSLDIALVTVKKHISSIFHKLDVKDRVALSILINQQKRV